MKKTIIAGLSVVTLLASTSTAALAYKGDPNVQGPNYSPERHTAMQAAFDAGANGFQNWLKLMENKAMRLKQVITNSDIFGEFATAHNSGSDAVTEFRNKYNLGTAGQGKGQGMRDGSGYGRNR